MELRVVLAAEQLRRAVPGGIGTYTRGLLEGLGSIGRPDLPDLTLYVSRSTERPDPLAALGVDVHASRLPGPLLTRAWDLGLVRAPRGADVVHSVSLATLEPGRAAFVVTVHDLLWRRVPDAYPMHGRRWHEAALQRALRRADWFVVPSEVVADDLVRAGAPAGQVSVIPMGSDHLPAPDHDTANALLARHGVVGPFLLSVGTIEPRKNFHRLVAAYEEVRDSLPGPWPLVLVGPNGWGEELRPAPGVVLAGPVDTAVLAALYGLAAVFVFVPLIEGFGLPPVEAMREETPIVASPMPSTGGAVFEVDPTDTGSIAAGIVAVATDGDLAARLVRLGRQHAAELTWKGVASAHLELWRSVRPSRRGARHG